MSIYKSFGKKNKDLNKSYNMINIIKIHIIK